jgi:hypothetical protein
MKVAYLNPWSSRAENQCYGSLAVAARRNGLELIDCRDENDLEPKWGQGDQCQNSNPVKTVSPNRTPEVTEGWLDALVIVASLRAPMTGRDLAALHVLSCRLQFHRP